MSRRQLPPGVSVSLSRALGIDKAKRQLSKDLGVPLTRSARQRKLGAGMGCCLVVAVPILALTVWGFHAVGLIA